MSYKRVTAEMLVAAGIDPTCSAMRKFRKIFPDGATCTFANCLKMARATLGMGWGIEKIMGEAKWRKFDNMTREAYFDWEEDEPCRGKVREALAQADAKAFHMLAKGILR